LGDLVIAHMTCDCWAYMLIITVAALVILWIWNL
jgi:hypothetical protein